MSFESIQVLRVATVGLGLALAAAQVLAQESVRVRGTITGIDGQVLSVKSREGENLKLNLAPKLSVGTVKALKLEDLKPGDTVGTTAIKGADGVLIARGLHVFEGGRLPNPGQRPWDLEPGATMTNATVAAVVQAAKGRELTLTYPGGSQKVIVPRGVPIVAQAPADRSFLKPGEYIFATAQRQADGTLVVERIQVSSGGVKPPQ
jgi:hypothetical protein